jgi:alpha-ribazole phosphatase
MMIVLVRHPPPDIAPGICYGRLDIPLRPGFAASVAAIVAAIGAHRPLRVWTSPARRCRTVAEAVGAPTIMDARLRELDFGDWEGRAWNDVPRAALDRWAADPAGFAPPNGETGAALLARVREVLAAIRTEGEDCAVISHGGPLKLLAALLLGEPADLLAQPPAIGSVRAFTG